MHLGGGPPYLIPPDGRRGDGAGGERPEGAHQQAAMAHLGIAGVEDAEQEEAHSSSQPGGEGEQGGRAPLGGVSVAGAVAVTTEAAARVVHGVHGADEAGSGRGRAGYERRLETVRRDVADERHVRVRLSRVPRTPEREPPPQQCRQRQQPEGARKQRKEPEAALREEGGWEEEVSARRVPGACHLDRGS
ncbi:hypothetical protein DL764_001065 [Monosporascus ibericus]|uniref:Uncharacterized protein n=1 Tax=Monosporascus ibericus TaxID=155417 RepID=A0A4Q4TR56_9PEZI|nr:hypothetical protein DL764_001065 [Monosporascus ibericus]